MSDHIEIKKENWKIKGGKFSRAMAYSLNTLCVWGGTGSLAEGPVQLNAAPQQQHTQ